MLACKLPPAHDPIIYDALDMHDGDAPLTAVLMALAPFRCPYLLLSDPKRKLAGFPKINFMRPSMIRGRFVEQNTL